MGPSLSSLARFDTRCASTIATLLTIAAIAAACGGAYDVVPDEARRAPVSEPPPASTGTSHATPPSAPAPPDPGVDSPPPLVTTGPGGWLDGVCQPGDVRLGTYDPDCVYVIGSTTFGAGGTAALFHPSAPLQLAYGWGAGVTALVRGDRRIVFTSKDPTGAYAFQPGLPSETTATHYARHAPIVTPACSGSALGAVLPLPNSGVGGGAGYYLCYQQGLHYYGVGGAIPFDVGGRYVLGLDENETALLAEVGVPTLASVAGGVEKTVGGFEARLRVWQRSRRGGGFLVVVVADRDANLVDLYDLDGTSALATKRGRYQMGSFSLFPSFNGSLALEPSGALQAIVQRPGGASRALVRLRIDAAPQVLYDETTTAPHLNAIQLVTGL